MSTENCDALRLTERERLILDLFDQEEELRLQQSLYEAQNSGKSTLMSWPCGPAHCRLSLTFSQSSI